MTIAQTYSASAKRTSVPDVGDAGSTQETTHAPRSCTVSWINFVAVANLIGATLILSRFNLPVAIVVLITLTVPALTIVILENIFIESRIAFRPVRSKGYVAAPIGMTQPQRIFLKIIGLAVSIGALAAVYWLAPIYHNGGAGDLLELIKHLWIPVLLFMPLYIWYVDKKSEMPEDGYFHVGLLFTGSWRLADRELLRQHCLHWLVKAFFLPLMLGFYFKQVTWLSQNPIENVLGPFLVEPNAANWLRLFHFLYNYLFIIDVGIACVGYALTLKLLDSEVRSTDPTLLGWVVCILCYAPFWAFIVKQYLDYGGSRWEVLFADWPTVKVFWSLLILFLVGVYVWATIQFGIRFSNLTHRGILTNGPYRWLKHPAYLAKNSNYWLISLPFLATGDIAEAIRLSLLLVGVNFLYYLRAKTEEAHLMVDPVYRQYVKFMRDNDVFALARRRIKRHLPARFSDRAQV